MTSWLSRHNHKVGKDKEIPGMCISTNAIEMYTTSQPDEWKQKKYD